jgi:two-component system, cell cycle sensor histidine kinase and response regulator CckA
MSAHADRFGLNYGPSLLLVAIACFVGALAGQYFVLPGLHVSAFWPPAGIALAAFFLYGNRIWPGVAVALTAGALVDGHPLLVALGIAAAGALAGGIGAFLLRRFGVAPGLDRLIDVFGFVVLGAFLSPVVSATLGIFILKVGGAGVPPAESWAWWWVGDALGAVVVGPLTVAWLTPQHAAPRRPRLELAAFTLVVLALIGNVFFTQIPSLAYVFFVPAIWAALRFGLRGTTLTTAVMAAVMIAATLSGRGVSGDDRSGVLILLSFLATLTITSLVLAAVTSERTAAERKRRQDGEVQRAVIAGSPLGIVALDVHGRVNGWNAAAERIFGYDSVEVLGKKPPTSIGGGVEETGFHEAALSGLAFSGVSVRRQRKDGATIELSLSTAPLRNEAGVINGVVEVFADLTERQKADEIIRQREARLKLILEQALDAVITIDADGRITGWNPQAERIFGWTAGEILGRRLSETIIPQRHRAQHEAGVERFLATGQSSLQNRRLEMPGLHRSGHEFPLELTIGSVKLGNNIIFSAFVRDITERKQGENALRASEDRYRAFIEQSTEATWCFELEIPMPLNLTVEEQVDFVYRHGFLSECNDEMARMYGFSRAGELIGLRTDQLLVRTDPGNQAYLEAFIRSGYRLTDAESHEKDREGRTKYFLNNLIGIIENDRMIRAWGTQRDVTVRKLAERQTDAFASLAQQLSGANQPIEAARIIVEVARDLCGWDACSLDLYSAEQDRVEAILTVDVVDGTAIETAPAYSGSPPSPMGRKVIQEGPQLILRAEGEIQPGQLMPFGDTARSSASLMFVPIQNKSAVIGILSIQSYQFNAYTSQDLTLLQSLANQCGAALERIRAQQELRRTEDQLRQAQKMEAVGRLAGGIAHDFNNLLTTILGTSDLLLEELPDTRQWRQDVEEIRRAGERAAGLTRQLLAFSRKQVIEAATVDLNETVAGVARMLHRLIGEDIEVITQLASDLGAVRADPGQLEQVLMNLAVNARDAMPGGGKLIIETSNVALAGMDKGLTEVPSGDYVMLAVSDNGVGMDAETRSHIFEPFFTTKEQGKGTGLGLATVYGIVRQSGGHIVAYSEKGAGATFKVFLPRVEEPAAPVRPARPETPRRGSETILVAEDEVAVRNLTRRVLEASGYVVITANGASEALEIAQRHPGRIHLLLTDVIMPGMSGPQLAAKLIAQRSDSKVLFMSGYTDAALLHHGVLERGLSYLQKPFSPTALAEKVREVLDSGGNQ